MSTYAIGDFHLSFNKNKPMNNGIIRRMAEDCL